MSESALVRQILLAYGKSPTVRLFRNNVGVLRDKRGNHVAYGLCPGSSDIIGWKSEMHTLYDGPSEYLVGGGRKVHAGPIARFVCLEAKIAPRKPTKEQVAFILAVDRAGGIAGVVYSVEDCYHLLGPP